MASSNGEAPHRPIRDSDGLSGETSIANLIGRPGVGMDHVPVNHLVHLAATLDSANYFSERMPQARLHDDKFQQLGDALRARGRDGLIAEFGVFEGATINFIAGQTEEPVFGFDCFSGLPEDWRPGFSVDNQRKDFAYCRVAAQEIDAAIPLTDVVDRLLAPLQESDRGGDTTAALYEVLLGMGA